MKLWNRKNLRKRDKSDAPPVEPLTRPARLWLLAALGLAVVPYIGELPNWLMILFFAIVSWCGLVIWRDRPLPSRTVLTIVALLAGAGVLIDFRTLFGRDAGVALLVAMAACKLLEARGLRDGVVLVFLGYLLVMSNLLYSQEIPIVAYLLGVVLMMLTAQMMIHRQHIGLKAWVPLRLAGKLALQALPVMLILFILFPRIPGPLWGLPRDAYKGRTGLSEEMMPGTVSQLVKSGEVAFRVRFTGPIPPLRDLYWRGPVLSNFDGRRWTVGASMLRIEPAPLAPESPALEYSVIMEPSNRIWLLALDLPALVPPQAGMTSAFQLLRRQPVNEVYRYQMRSYLRYRTGDLTARERSGNLRLPPWGNPRARVLAAEWKARDSRPEALLNTALTMFRDQAFYYTLTPPLLGKDSVDEFLFNTRQGFCEHYASAFVFLMRAAGVPARVVTGYQGGERNTFGDYLIVRQSDAHAWAEVWLEGRGWVRVDPTGAVAPNRIQEGLYTAVVDAEGLPFLARHGGESEWLQQLVMGWDTLNNAWNEWVLAYGPDQQKEFLLSLGFRTVDWADMTIAMTVALGSLVLVIVVWRWRTGRSPDPVVRAWQQFCERLARHGLTRGAQEGPLAFTARVAAQRPELARPVQAIGQLYATLRYGPVSSPEAVRQLGQWVRQFRA